ncbi:MAG TPA: hypothetical protein VHF25_15270 [Nitriliruptorales bacterium]|nr:hypothetical protein [Nitriliruptorales bacterium]
MRTDRDLQDGFVTVQHVAAAALSLVVLTVVANLIVFQYARGVVVAALHEGARAGSRTAATVGRCEQRVRDALGDVLGGDLGRGVAVVCHDDGRQVVAEADVRWDAFAPGVADWAFRLRATAVKERGP